MNRQLFTRKDVAQILEVSEDFVRKNEEKLGLRVARIKLSRMVRYRRDLLAETFRAFGVTLPPFQHATAGTNHPSTVRPPHPHRSNAAP